MIVPLAIRRLDHAPHQPGYATILRKHLAVGGDFELTRLWLGSRKLERQYKQRKAAPRLLCPVCPTRAHTDRLAAGQGVLPDPLGGG
jgi:hypothetical protein